MQFNRHWHFQVVRLRGVTAYPTGPTIVGALTQPWGKSDLPRCRHSAANHSAVSQLRTVHQHGLEILVLVLLCIVKIGDYLESVNSAASCARSFGKHVGKQINAMR